MIRSIPSRGRMPAAVSGSAASTVRIVGYPAGTRTMSSSVTSRPLLDQSKPDKANGSHRTERSPSPPPRNPNRTVTTSRVMSPKPSSSSFQRSYGTAPLVMETFMGAATCGTPVRHTFYHSLHDTFPIPLSTVAPTYHHHHQEDDYDEWNMLQGYVATAKGAVETVLSTAESQASVTTTTDMDMDVVSDDEEWELPPYDIASSSAEQVLAMMDNSYYHASYKAKDLAGDEQSGVRNSGD
ncbi:hypothetical protein IV203_019408 [Nitzschia inconspicua]|uniref:Uncharacterized protein n=1 Tax=Nitzschia inconspicua TaxID=303405 RepID=A0A9K3LYF1_9STRA|nr:hypothetical protein IV203_019408 [Nitzschia inconspicua]